MPVCEMLITIVCHNQLNLYFKSTLIVNHKMCFGRFYHVTDHVHRIENFESSIATFVENLHMNNVTNSIFAPYYLIRSWTLLRFVTLDTVLMADSDIPVSILLTNELE